MNITPIRDKDIHMSESLSTRDDHNTCEGYRATRSPAPTATPLDVSRRKNKTTAAAVIDPATVDINWIRKGTGPKT